MCNKIKNDLSQKTRRFIARGFSRQRIPALPFGKAAQALSGLCVRDTLAHHHRRRVFLQLGFPPGNHNHIGLGCQHLLGVDRRVKLYRTGGNIIATHQCRHRSPHRLAEGNAVFLGPFVTEFHINFGINFGFGQFGFGDAALNIVGNGFIVCRQFGRALLLPSQRADDFGGFDMGGNRLRVIVEHHNRNVCFFQPVQSEPSA